MQPVSTEEGAWLLDEKSLKREADPILRAARSQTLQLESCLYIQRQEHLHACMSNIHDTT